MNDYVISLALAYFKEKGENYDIGEMMEMFGYTWARLSDLLDMIMERQLIAYSDNLIKITNKGLAYLIAHNQGNMNIRKDGIELLYIHPDKAQSIEKPYVPVKFLKKYHG